MFVCLWTRFGVDTSTMFTPASTLSSTAMDPPPVGARRRATGQSFNTVSTRTSVSDEDEHYVSTYTQVFRLSSFVWKAKLTPQHLQRTEFQNKAESSRTSMMVVGALTALAFFTRFYKINNPDEVV